HVAKEDKVKVVKNTFDGRISDDLTGLLVMVVEKNHARDINHILEYFIKQVKEYKKIGVVKVTTATELSDTQKAAVEKRILETTAYESLEVDYHQDKTIIGGMIIRIADRVVDSSIRTKLDGMSKALAGA
ncbi:MAG: ATP synthase F1 subunit delta, partial [Lachnospiraceae bacterium]|nr:ATP synthase F1 subunit delta [Lachnospiraceae bacterium]